MNYLYELKKIILYSGQEKVTYELIEVDIRDRNRRSTVALGAIAALFFIVMTLVSFMDDELAVNRLVYLFSGLGMAVISVLSNTLAKQYVNLANLLMYLFLILLFCVGIIIGTITIPDETTTTYIAFLLTVPQLINKKPYKLFILNMSSVAVFSAMVILKKDPSTWDSDIINGVVFGLIGCIVGTYNSIINTQRFYLEHTIRYMAETDQLTGLKNRNCYEENLRKANILSLKSIFCVYVDVNGLHELNNTKGHEAGDQMLQYVATAMQNIFGKNDSYRIGGDEFVAFGYNKEEAEVNALVEKLKQAVDAAGYTIAVGTQYVERENTELGTLVKSAESKMYDDKRRFYSEQEITHHRKRF